MPAKSPVDISDSTLRFTVKVEGSPIKDYYPVVSVTVTHELNKISYAEIVLIDGTVESADFPISDSSDLIPGNTIEITAGYGEDAETSIFSGYIVRQNIRIDHSEASQLIITCKHKAVTMSFNKKEAQFSKKADSDIIKSVIGTYGLSCTVDATSPVQEVVFQKLSTDWDFILARAEYYGYVVSFDGDKMIVGKPLISGSAVLRVAFGESLLSFRGELNAEKQPTALQVSGWDIKNQALLNSSAAEPTINAQGNLAAKALSAKLSQSQLNLTCNTPLAQDDLQAWADGNLLRMRLAAVKGDLSFIGSPLAKPNTIIDLEGVGERFNGSAYISSVTHAISEGKWITSVRFGLEYKTVTEQPDFGYMPAAGQVPPIRGLQVATVKKLFEDPDSQFRILLTLPSNAENQDGLWARVSNFYATNSAGAGFLPEVGDEVVIGFLESDPRYPVVLGSLYSSAKPAAATPADNNNYIKTIITKSKLKISFDDEKKITTILTPGGNSITLSDDAKSIELVDQNSNSVKMTSSGIDLQSNKDINLNATGNITLNATGKLNLTAKQDVAVSGMNVNNTAQVGFTAKGNATAEISASGQTVVKGGIVMIN
ncbi:MAG: type VI secretion system tip protein VgrG [Bacteroidetes bacterium]|nr:type VI secretion system tip protein VgrG [Bacteroidota bacterium]